MKERRKEEEIGVLERESVAPLVDPALAQNNRLAPGAKGITDDGPFLESDAHASI
jgi:hypothetical protein